MTDNVASQTQLDAANQRIRELETAIRLDAVQTSVNTPDMTHEPCEKVRELSEDVKTLREESQGTTVDTATVVGKLNILLGIGGGAIGMMCAVIAWIVVTMMSQGTRIAECCVDSHRFEAFELKLNETVEHLRSIQPSTVAKSP